MKVNTKKTSIICISDSLNYDVGAYILDSSGQRIKSGAKMKVLGWHFSTKPNADAYINVLQRRFRQCYWILRHLKQNGFAQEDLIKVYTTMLRPVADYMQEIYHSMISDRQDEAIERLQTYALRCIFGHRLSSGTGGPVHASGSDSGGGR